MKHVSERLNEVKTICLARFILFRLQDPYFLSNIAGIL